MLFHKNGHLTDNGLQALLTEQLDELGRLEAAEHLSFCDDCLTHYTTLLADEHLVTPPTPVKPGVQKKLRKRSLLLLRNRYATIAAAACLAVGLWAGTIAFHGGTPQAAPPAQATTQQDSFSLGTLLNNGAQDLSSHLDTLFNDLRKVLPTPPSPGHPTDNTTDTLAADEDTNSNDISGQSI